MARGLYVTGQPIEQYISEVFSAYDKKWTAAEVQKEVVYNLNHDPKLRKRLNLPAILPPNWPGLDAVNRVLAKIRKYDKEHPSDPEQMTWSLATIKDYPIESQALSAVIDLCMYRIENNEVRPTIREAKWAARVSGIYEKDWAKKQHSGKWLSMTAFFYAFLEKISEQIGSDFTERGSRLLDEVVLFFGRLKEYPDLRASVLGETRPLSETAKEKREELKDLTDSIYELLFRAYDLIVKQGAKRDYSQKEAQNEGTHTPEE